MKKIIKILLISILLIFLSINIVVAYNEKNYNNHRENENSIIREYLIKLFRGREIFSSESLEVSQVEKDRNNVVVGTFGVALIIYWIILIVIFEKEDMYEYKATEKLDDIELFEKYNPMLAGALAQNRQVLPRDLTAIILNLIHKKAINMRMTPNLDVKQKEQYIYMISENKEEIHKLDNIEKYVLNWLFGFYEDDEVDLIKKLKQLSKSKDFSKNIKKLNEMTQRKLNKLGANICRVPFVLRIVNVFLIIISIFTTVVHIMNNGLDIHIYMSTILVAIFVLIFIIMITPVIAVVMHILLLLMLLCKKYLKLKIENYSGKEIVSTSVITIMLMIIILVIAYFIVQYKYICLDIFIIFMSMLIIKTDHLMLKNNKEIMQDYYALQEIKTRIEEYSLIKEHQINYIELWEQYLVYAVAFGIPIEIVNKLNGTYKEDKDIRYMMEAEALYYVCKAYLEVMCEMKFDNKRKLFNLSDWL